MRPTKKPRFQHRHVADLDDGESGFRPFADDDAVAFGEEFVAGATSNDAIGEIARDEVAADETMAYGFLEVEDSADTST